MKIGIGLKLFVAVLVASTVMAVAVGIASRVSFQRGFLGYLNELESRRLSVLTTILAAHWREAADPDHGWDALRGRDDLWRHIVRYSGYRLHSGPRHIPMLLPPVRSLQLCRDPAPGLIAPYALPRLQGWRTAHTGSGLSPDATAADISASDLPSHDLPTHGRDTHDQPLHGLAAHGQHLQGPHPHGLYPHGPYPGGAYPGERHAGGPHPHGKGLRGGPHGSDFPPDLPPGFPPAPHGEGWPGGPPSPLFLSAPAGLPPGPGPMGPMPGLQASQGGMVPRQLVPGQASADVGRAAQWWWLLSTEALWPREARAAAHDDHDDDQSPENSLLDSLMENAGELPSRMPLHHPPQWLPGVNKPPIPPDAAARMTLQDAAGRFVVGNPNPGPDAHFVPILVDGVVAGWVGSERFTEVTDAADLSFQRRQESAAWYIAVLAVLLAAGIAWLLGRVMLVPARRLASATRALAAGQYDIRVPATSQDELGQLARVFNRLASTLQSNESMRRAFMADVSHELRTPLAIMRGELEAVEDGLQPLDQRVVQSLQSEVAILSKLVEDIHVLSITEVAPMAYHWEQVDVVELLDTTLASWQERLAARGLHLKRVGVIDKMPVSGDPNRLRQVFQNLLENAVRYVDQGGLVQVGCQSGNPGVIITFDDSGPGMPAEDHPRLFDRFYRREASRNRATGGSGLGLAICRGIVDAHGGRISAEASPLGGLRIRIELPPEQSSEGTG